MITWTPISNLTLISGQGTSKAIFRGTNNGVGKVKVDIQYVGQDISLENSDIWVGVPAQPSILGFGTLPFPTRMQWEQIVIL